MKILPKTRKDAMEIVYNILNQGDSRYNAPEDEITLSESLVNESVFLEEREIPLMEKPINAFKEVQWEEKFIAKYILKVNGFQDNQIFSEIMFNGNRPDILAESPAKKIAVECRSCRVNKILDYLFSVDEVWVITRGLPPYETIPYLKEKMCLFVFRKGKNWDKVIDLRNKRQDQIKAVKPLVNKL